MLSISSDFFNQQCEDNAKHDNKINKNCINKSGLQSKNATILIIHAPVAAGKSADETDKQK